MMDFRAESGRVDYFSSITMSIVILFWVERGSFFLWGRNKETLYVFFSSTVNLRYGEARKNELVISKFYSAKTDLKKSFHVSQFYYIES